MLLDVVYPLNEVYFGKTPEIQRIEKQLDIFRSKYMTDYLGNPYTNQDSDLMKFNRMMEDQFGFGVFTLSIIEYPEYNAFTLPIDSTFDTYTPDKLMADKKTFKFDKRANYSCLVFVTSGIIFNPEFTTEEVMAIIMHEVGHNFYCALNGVYGTFNKIYSVVSLFIKIAILMAFNPISGAVLTLISTNQYRASVQKLNNELREHNPCLMSMFDFLEYLVTIYGKVWGEINNILARLSLGFLIPVSIILNYLPRKIKNPLSFLFMPFSFNNEQTADNFATMYGYAGPLGSALDKMGKDANNPNVLYALYNKIPIVSHIYQLNMSISQVLIGPFDEHPANLARIQDQLDMLKRELNKEDLDPKMKKAIQLDIDACNKQIQRMTKLEGGIKDRNFAAKLYDDFLYQHMGSRRIKDHIFNRAKRFKDYDDTYERLNK